MCFPGRVAARSKKWLIWLLRALAILLLVGSMFALLISLAWAESASRWRYLALAATVGFLVLVTVVLPLGAFLERVPAATQPDAGHRQRTRLTWRAAMAIIAVQGVIGVLLALDADIGALRAASYAAGWAAFWIALLYLAHRLEKRGGSGNAI
jgi:hypothetical protein